jgi:hypothetical protein
MKILSTILLFCLLTPVLSAQNDSIRRYSYTQTRTIDPLTATDWHSFSFHFGLSGTYTEGSFKKFVKPPVAINVGLEARGPHLFALNFIIRPTTLQQSFTNDGQLWKKDTSLSFITFQAMFGYQAWASKRTALYLIGGLGLHNISVKTSDKQQNNNCNCNCDNKDGAWSMTSFAPSTGFLVDFRQRKATPAHFREYYHDSSWRLKVTLTPAWFAQMGSGTLLDAGIGYSF